MSALFHNDFDRLLKERMQSHGGVDVEKFRESAGKIREAELAKGRERSARFRAAHPELANDPKIRIVSMTEVFATIIHKVYNYEAISPDFVH